MDAISVTGLRKEYGDVVAVDGVSFTVAEGEVFALLGPNGAGKTTTVEILEGHRRRTSGAVRVLGHDPQDGGREYREQIGVVLQEAGFDEEFTVAELVRLYRGMYPRRRDVTAVIADVGLTEKSDARVKTLSGGQRRRLDLALGLVGNPRLLFLDEPTTGFDPTARRLAWELIERLAAQGMTVLLTTHYLEEAEYLADRVGVVVHGRLVALGTPGELGSGLDAVVTFRLPEGRGRGDLPSIAAAAEPVGQEWRLITSEPITVLHELTGWSLERGIDVPSLSVHQPTLEDVYLSLVSAPGGNPDGQAAGAPVPARAVPR